VRWRQRAGTNIVLYPNPVTNDLLQIQWTSSETTAARWLIYNAHGQEVRSGDTPVVPGPNECAVNVAALPAGVYLLRLRSRDSDWSGHFLRR